MCCKAGTVPEIIRKIDMAYAAVKTTHTFHLPEALTHFVTGMKQAMVRRHAYKATLNEMDCLTDRELADIGVTRAGIPAIARLTAYSS